MYAFRLCCFALSGAFVVSVALPGQVTWKVPGHAASINEAIQLAQAGDRIELVATTPYGSGADATGILVDKALTIEPSPGQRAVIAMDTPMRYAIHATGLGGGARLVLRNLDVVPNPDITAGFSRRGHYECVRVELGAAERGVVVLDGIVADGLLSNADDPCPGLVVHTGTGIELQVRGCVFRGAPGDVPWLSPAEAAWRGSSGGEIDHQGPGLLQASRFVGGEGGDAWWSYWTNPAARDGGPGLLLQGARTAVAGCTVVDGKGGDVYDSHGVGRDPCTMIGQAGHSVFDGDLFDVHHVPAAVGSAPGCPGTAPPAVMLGAGRLDLAVSSSQPATTETVAVLARTQPAGQGATALVFGASLQPQAVAGWGGTLYAGGLFWAMPVAPPPSGTLALFTLPSAAGVSQSTEIVLQLAHVSGSAHTLGAPVGLTFFVPSP